jgi:hypothetical protein
MVHKKSGKTGSESRIYKFVSASWSNMGNSVKIHHYVVKPSQSPYGPETHYTMKRQLQQS